MKLIRIGLVALVFLLAGMLAASTGLAQPEGLQFRDVLVGGATHRYEVYVPQGWTREKEWPVILMLHGAGLRGEYGAGQGQFVIGPLFLGYQGQRLAEFPFVVVFPRVPLNHAWTEPAMEAVALAALEQSIREFRGDRARVYLTGLSMGGYGTWYIASRHPELFAAIAPVCPGVRALPAYSIPAASVTPDPYADLARRIGKLPVWVFHGALDDQIDVSESRRMVAALKVAGANVRYTEYPDVKHNAWERAYAAPALFLWLLSHGRTIPPIPPK